jgi:hypothetical protein
MSKKRLDDFNEAMATPSYARRASDAARIRRMRRPNAASSGVPVCDGSCVALPPPSIAGASPAADAD